MLQAIRDHTAGWIAGFVVFLLAIPFALWGINNYFTAQVDSWVAIVNGEEIDQAEYQERMANYRQRLAAMMGENFDPTIFEQPDYKRQFVDSLVKERVLTQAVSESGYAIPSQRVAQEIAGYQAFQVNGEFDGEQYRRTLQRVGMTPTQFESRIRESLKSQSVPDALRASQLVTDAEINALIRLQNQTRTFDYFLLEAAAYRDQVSVSDEEIQSYYDTHSDEFMTPEQVSIRYLELDAADLAETIKVDEATLQSWFEENRSSYLTTEQRLASHILFEVPEDAPPEEIEQARERAMEAVERIEQGEDFAAVARDMSDDAGSAQSGGDLGWIERGQMAGAFEEALFALEEGQVSEPVQTGYGFHVIQLRDVQEPQGQTFAEAREEVAADYRESEAERLYLEQADRLVDLTYENPGSLQPAADALGLEVQTAGPFTRDGGEEGIATEEAVVETAFSDLVLQDRVNSDPVELGRNHVAVLRVDQHLESRLLPLEEVRGEIRDTLLTQKAEEAAASRAESLVEALQAGDMDLEAAAASVERQPVSADAVQRSASGHPRPLLQEVFSQPAPQSPPRYSALPAGRGATAVVALRDITPGDPSALTDAERERLRQQLAQGYVSAETDAMIQSLEAKAEVRIAEDRL